MNNEAIPIISAYRPNMTRIGIHAEHTGDFPAGRGVGTGFSGGVDSFYTIAGNIGGAGRAGSTDPLTHLFFFNVGTNGLGRSLGELEHVRRKFLMRYEKFLPTARMIGLPFIPVDSNVPSFLPDNILANITVSNASAVHFVRKGLKKYLLSSAGYNYEQLFRVFRTSNADMDVIAPILCPWLGDDSLRLIPCGTAKSRIEKMKLIVDYPPARHCLNVCNSTEVMEENCSVCLKCRRTMTDLEILGKLDDFRDVFKVDEWRDKYKSRDLAGIWRPAPNDIFSHSSRRYAAGHDIDIKSQSSAADRFFAYMHATFVYRLLKNIHLLDILKRCAGRR
ncbi:MAG: hypothetical protein IJJ28_04770 [Lentisphaeria bacterium]|nr:hypothetical protein [Lentisphaeria bacterium]